ncbi:MAG: LEA type 2 family protein [Gammaproteobacteria bacterium]|nr:LEA type 2 family protein [Gammaproteobacteria bacterium]
MASWIRRGIWMGLLLALAGCAALQQQIKNPEVAVEQVEIARLSLSDVDLNVRLGVHNPNPLGLSLAGLDYRLEIDQRPLIQGRSDQQLKLPANGQSSIALPLSLGFAELLGGLEALGGRQSIPYALSGTMNFGLFSVPFNYRGELQLPELPRMRIESLRVLQFNLSGVALLLGLQLDNPNDFPIRLNGMDYRLELAGQGISQGELAQAVNLAAGEQGRTELALQLNYSQLGNLFTTLQRGSSIPVDFDASLRVPALRGEQVLPLRWQGDVGIVR